MHNMSGWGCGNITRPPFISMKRTVSVLTVPIFLNLAMMNKLIVTEADSERID